MSTNLQNTLSDLASTFTQGVLAAIRESSLEELSPGAVKLKNGHSKSNGKSNGKRVRRSQADIDALSMRICNLVAKNTDGMRAEAIRAELGVPSKELPRALKAAVAEGHLRSTGQKRATTYFVKGKKKSKK